MVAQLAREQQIGVEVLEEATARPSADTDGRDLHIVDAAALWNGDGEAFWVSEAASDALDDVGQALRRGEAYDTAHASVGMRWFVGGDDGGAGM